MRILRWCRLVLLFLLLVWLPSPTRCEDLYAILSVPRDASTQDIKRAYRRKARDTHPDKNPDQAQATEEFRKVVDAFEILSDANARRNYDRTGRTTRQQHTTGNQQQWRSSTSHFHFVFQKQKRRLLKDDPKVKEAQLRVMHVVSLEQLQTVMLDDQDELLERSLLICFMTPQVEEIANDQLVFPWPFAGMSRQGIWWEEILQTVVVRYHRENDLTRFFGIPHGDELKEPMMVLARKGNPLEKFQTYSTSNHKEFYSWVWGQLRVNVEFVNRHSHPVELYWIDGTRGRLQETIQPGKSRQEYSSLSHEYMARDARVDRFKESPNRNKLSSNSLLGTWKILSTEDQVIVIETKACVDSSGHCPFWSTHPKGECDRNPGFMHETCPLTCGVCSEDDNNTSNTNDEL